MLMSSAKKESTERGARVHPRGVPQSPAHRQPNRRSRLTAIWTPTIFSRNGMAAAALPER